MLVLIIKIKKLTYKFQKIPVIHISPQKLFNSIKNLTSRSMPLLTGYIKLKGSDVTGQKNQAIRREFRGFTVETLTIIALRKRNNVNSLPPSRDGRQERIKS